VTPESVRASVLVAIVVVALVGPLATFAQADGDPASDVLLTEGVFYPYSEPVSRDLQRKLDAETTALSRTPFPLRVALIGAPVDLGSYPHVFGQPSVYAQLLGEELSLYGSHKMVLVVMANGYGVYGVGQAATRAATTLSPPRSGRGDDLARAAITSVRTLAAAARHPVAAINDKGAVHSAKRGRSSALLVVALALAASVAAGSVLVARRRRRFRGGSE
jgi:hypothetical protein